jgi:hypothetical protein
MKSIFVYPTVEQPCHHHRRGVELYLADPAELYFIRKTAP